MKNKKFKMPTSYTIVFIALSITALLSYFVPQSVVDPESGKIVMNAIFSETGEILIGQGLQPFGLWDVIMAPIKGFQSAADVGVGILMAGGFLAVLNHTGALEAGISNLLEKFEGTILIAVMMLVFAILGTSFGFWEEITAFSVVVVPMFVLAGYDVMTGLAVLFVGASIGNMASLVNPFSTGAAVAAISNPDLSLGSGIVLRSILFVVLYIIGTSLVIQYAKRVQKNPKLSVISDIEYKELDTHENLEYTKQRRKSVAIFVFLVIFMILGFFPWQDLLGDRAFELVNMPFKWLASIPVIGNLLGAGHITPLGLWGFNEFAFLFLFGSFVLNIINKMSETEFLRVFIEGLTDLLGVVVVLAIARGIAIIMGDASHGMSITFIYWISNALSSVPLWIFGIFAMLAYVLIGLFLQSTSGVAGISMPILGAVASALFVSSKLGAVGGQIILVSAFTTGVNFMSSIYPGATLMGTIELFDVPYDRYLKFMLKIMFILLFVSAVIISIAPYIGIVK